ncbi:hypothetical protein [Neobacillus drentensis]|uniref:hypothetical protein n=1 Tax=Neobacillus drentensis TaxID=220684 RepID=UPI0028650C1A|nr:hypothetical protein [Neobacillus drentensis]MDR7240657.1 hypothetical protein [Neobacillus drentensis]
MLKKLIYFLVFLVQFSGIGLAIVLENLSSKKMGVARYLIYRKQEFEATLFTPANVHLLMYLLILGTIVCLALLLIKKGGGVVLFAALVNIIGIIFIQFEKELQAFHFFILGILIVLVIQYVWMIYFYLRKPEVK